jgi:5'-deoxynucleotidase YfbR-like HD superfamily hydrolase
MREVLLSGHVTRCHTVPGGCGHQTTAHHAWGVAMLVVYLWPDVDAMTLHAALAHDVAERWVGDVPAQAKWNNPVLANELEAHEDHVMAGLGLDYDLAEDSIAVIALADKVELYLYSQHRANLGDGYAGEILHRLHGWFRKHASLSTRFPKVKDLIQ